MSIRNAAGVRSFAAGLLERRDDYGVALVLVIATIIGLAAAGSLTPDREFVAVLGAATVLFVVHTSGLGPRAVALAGAFLAVVGGSFVATALGASGRGSDVTTACVGLVLTASMVLAIGLRIVRSRVVTFRLLLGGLCIYLLIGLAFAYGYLALESVEAVPSFAQAIVATAADYVYFSFVALTTLGFGDLTAGTPVGRALVVLEAVTGQAYLISAVAILVARASRMSDRR